MPPSPALSRWLHGRPALVAAALFVLGISFYSLLWRCPAAWLILSAGLLLTTWKSRRDKSSTEVCLALCIVTSGIFAGQLAAYQFPANHIALFASDEPRLAWIEVTLSETPRLFENTSPRHLPGRQMGRANVVAVKTWNGWEPADGDIEISVPQSDAPLAAGQRVRLFGMLERPAPALNPGQFDWEYYYRRQRLLVTMHVNHAWNIQRVSQNAPPALATSRVEMRNWLAAGFDADHQVDRALLQALMLGDRGPELNRVENDFQKTGASHLLSSSGVRLGILAGMLYFFCRLARLSPRMTALVLALGVISWGYLTMPTPQALRPVVIAAALGTGLAIKRRTDSIQLLGFAAIFLLIVHPLDLFGAGFQFSFVIVLGLLLLTPPVMESLRRFHDPDSIVLASIGRIGRWRRLRGWIVHHFMHLLVSSAVAWVVSLPLVAYHFEQFTPWVIPLSILLSPVVCAALAGGFLKLILSILVPSQAATWATLADAPVAILRWAIHHAAALPGADIPCPAPPPWAIGLFYLMICLPLLPAPRISLRWCARCVPLGACPLLLLTPWLLGFASQSTSRGTLRVTLLSIGAGQCAVIEPPVGRAMMVDAGSSTVQDCTHLCIEPFLHHEGRVALDQIFLSHGDYDHISAVASAWAECGVEQVITSPHFRKHADESIPCRHLLELLDGSHRSPREVFRGQTFTIAGGGLIEVLWPPKQCDFNSNNAGMVLRLNYGGRSILFPADIQDPAMHELLLTPDRLQSDILIAPHHGSSETLTAEFVRAVNPRVIVSSDATRLTKKQRDFENLIEHRPLYRTSRCGAVTIDLNRDGRIAVTPFLTPKQKAMVVGSGER